MMSAWTIISLVLTYGPGLLKALVSLITAIRTRNPVAGSAAITQASDLALRVVLSLAARNDLTNEAKREMAVADLLVGAKMVGVLLSESQARTLTELAYQQVKAA